ncbi:sugar ABC transporter permease [Haloferax sp. Atlit-47N]|uniref:Sugar ABC transporter permease n=1 Tax=Haloferax lucentense (strain DSM 14919 / JCM 9276 / NCIMB 13854 / Aa 2.2) TaxID=1230452 RepID=M0GUM5_HALL2|nr:MULTISPECIES: sugar ABC transporter permease [Haloferax]ELK55804.1 sugar ABC transporter permease [Haloferax sp. BAB-2207]ELZ75278.1 sugar ABC transporter permease [Haloferax lucentense DSM 14919]MBC9986851.1 sugar ABC transporter permease [Haloferax sp. AS1]RDZ38943.1 sugar ABC transporter permease [Haloferax sp. Atlit-47N]
MSTINKHGSRARQLRDEAFEFLSKKKVLAALTILPPMLLFTFVNLVPIVGVIGASFFSINAFSNEWQWIGVANFETLLSSDSFYDALSRSVVYAGGSVVIQVVFGTTLALLLNRSFKFVNIARTFAILPYLIPNAVIGFMALWMLNSQWGIVNQLAVQIGLTEGYVSFFGNQGSAMLAAILTSSWKDSIFVTVMVLARLQAIPESFYEAAKMSGATAYQRFRDITLPNLKGVFFIVLLLRAVWMFNTFDYIWVLTQGGPRGATTTAPIYAYNVAFGTSRLGIAAAVSTVLFLVLLVAAVLYFRIFEPSAEVRAE